jgi:Cu/Ag efflux pump CusA
VQSPLATVVIGGLLAATVLPLVVLPALHSRFAGQSVVKPANEGNGMQRAAE